MDSIKRLVGPYEEIWTCPDSARRYIGGFDYAETKVIAKRAYKFFIEGDYSSSEDDIEDADVIDVEE